MSLDRQIRSQRAAIALATVAFVILSALVHLGLGSAIDSLLPHFRTAAPDIITRMSISELATPTPTPVPTPTPRPTAAPSHVPAARTPVRSNKPRAIAVKPPKGHRQNAPSDARTPAPTASSVPYAETSPTQAPAVASPTPEAPQTIIESQFKHRAEPDYPPVCAQEGITGRVVVEITIGPDGSLVSAAVGQTSGFPCLDEAALAAAKESTYEAPEVDGRAATKTYLIVYDFTLDS